MTLNNLIISSEMLEVLQEVKQITNCIILCPFYLNDTPFFRLSNSICVKPIRTPLFVIDEEIVFENCVFESAVSLEMHVLGNASFKYNIFKSKFSLGDSFIGGDFHFENNIIKEKSDIQIFSSGKPGHGTVKGKLMISFPGGEITVKNDPSIESYGD